MPATPAGAPEGAGPRTFGVEEEMLLVNRRTFRPTRGAHATIESYLASHGTRPAAGAPELTLEVKEEQIEVVSPPASTLADLERSIRRGRRVAIEAAAAADATVAALGTSPYAEQAHVVPNERYLRMAENFGRILEETLTCGFHVHVAVSGLEEGVAVLDRIRVWLPIILGLSANSPFWHDAPSGFASYRYQAWGRWPTTGPSGIFGSAQAYRDRVALLMDSGVPLDEGMVYFDARYSARVPTVEIRVADVCTDAHHAATLATAIRALVETASRRWREGTPPDQTTADVLRVWHFQASRAGARGPLVDARTRRAATAEDAVAGLLEHIGPALEGFGERGAVEDGLRGILAHGGGADAQLDAYRRRGRLEDVVADVVERTAG